jgi:hypothetical protein
VLAIALSLWPICSAGAAEQPQQLPNVLWLIAENMGPDLGGIAAIHTMVRHLGLDAALNDALLLLKIHAPYMESDHVLNMTYNILAVGDCLEDLERLREDEMYVDAIGAERIPDPTTAGDFCRRFDEDAIVSTTEAVNRLTPGNGMILNTLGVAQYRTGHYQQAVATLTLSDKLNKGIAEDLAFLGMAQCQIGQINSAEDTLARLREQMEKPPYSDDSESQAFLREAETLIEGWRDPDAGQVSTYQRDDGRRSYRSDPW